MKLRTGQIMDLLRAVPGRYVEEFGRYRLKEADGADVTVTDRGQRVPVEPDREQIDDLLRVGLLVHEGSRFVPRG